jgi:hypothetical protein
MTTAFQTNDFQSNAFQEEGGLTTSDVVIGINATQGGDTGTLAINVAADQVTGGWPIPYLRRRRIPRETVEIESPEEITARIVASQQAILLRKELRRAERRSEEITAQLRDIYAEQDALLLVGARLEAEVDQRLDEDDLALILSLAS